MGLDTCVACAVRIWNKALTRCCTYLLSPCYHAYLVFIGRTEWSNGDELEAELNSPDWHRQNAWPLLWCRMRLLAGLRSKFASSPSAQRTA